MSLPVVSIFEGQYETHIRLAAERLRAGALVVLPTETVYGAVAALDRPEALERLRQLRPSDQPHAFIPHLARPSDCGRFLGPLSEFGQRCVRKLWPGPVALVFDVPAERRREVAAAFKLNESDLFEDQTITPPRPDQIAFPDVVAHPRAPAAAATAGCTPA